MGTSVARNLVMLDPLRRSDEPGIADFIFRIFVRHFVAFRDQPFHAFAFRRAGRFIVALENLLQPFCLALRLREMLGKRRGKFPVRRRLRHFRQRFDELILRAVKVLEFVNVQVA